RRIRERSSLAPALLCLQRGLLWKPWTSSQTKSRGSQDGADQINENQGQHGSKAQAAFRTWPIPLRDVDGRGGGGNPDFRDRAANNFGPPADALGGAAARDCDPVALCAPAGNVATSGVYFSI